MIFIFFNKLQFPGGHELEWQSHLMYHLFTPVDCGSRLFLLIRYYRISKVFQSFSYINISAIEDLRNHKFLDTPIR